MDKKPSEVNISSINKKIIKLLAELSRQNWAIIQASRISLRVSPFVGFEELVNDLESPYSDLDQSFPNLAGHYIMLSNSETPIRKLIREPSEHIGIFKVEQNGRRLIRLGPGRQAMIPITSTVLLHLRFHEWMIGSRLKMPVVVLAEPDELLRLEASVTPNNAFTMTDLLVDAWRPLLNEIPNGQKVPLHQVFETDTNGNLLHGQIPGLVFHQRHGVFAASDSFGDLLPLLRSAEKAAGIARATLLAGAIRMNTNRE